MKLSMSRAVSSTFAIVASGALVMLGLEVVAHNSTRPVHIVQASSKQLASVEPRFITVDREAADVKRGSEPAIRTMTGQLIDELGVPPAISAAYGYKERVVQGELLYRRGALQGIKEDDVVRGVNNLVSATGAPSWSTTNVHEVKRLRMLLVMRYPHLIASEAPPDANGHYKALDDAMSPLEATYIGGSMIQQKLLNPDFQFGDQEKSLPAYIDSTQRNAISASRHAAFSKALSGQSSGLSTRDLLNTADNFLTDLHVPQAGTEVSR
jgi:hypothetical protein